LNTTQGKREEGFLMVPVPPGNLPPGNPPWKTIQVMRARNWTQGQLSAAIRSLKFTPPAKDISGDYRWTEADVERLAAALALDLRRARRKRPAGCVQAGTVPPDVQQSA
jgi:hypothetical protein